MVVKEANGDERLILDSCGISQYLDETYGSPKRSIFNGDAGRHFSRFIEAWVDRSLAAEIRPCVLHTSYALFPENGPVADAASRKAFLDKCGQARMDELISLNSDREWTSHRYAGTRKELGTVETMLRERSDRGESGAFLGGSSPIHADFCIYAFYAYSRTNKELVEETWHHPSLPFVQQWLKGMQLAGLVSEAELLGLA